MRRNLRAGGILWKLFACSFAHTHTHRCSCWDTANGSKGQQWWGFQWKQTFSFGGLGNTSLSNWYFKIKMQLIPIWCHPLIIIIGTDTIRCPGEGCLKSISVTMKRKVGWSMFSSEWATSITRVHNSAWKLESEEKRVFLQCEPSIIGARVGLKMRRWGKK